MKKLTPPVAIGALLLIGAIVALPVLKLRESNGPLLALKTSFISDLAFRSNTTLVVQSATSLQFWDVRNGQVLQQRGNGNGSSANFSPDGQLMLSGHQVRDVRAGVVLSTLQGDTQDFLVAPVFSPDKTLMASPVWLNKGKKDRHRVCAWNVKTGTLVWSVPFSQGDDMSLGDDGYKHPVAFSPDSQWLVEASVRMRSMPQKIVAQGEILLRQARTGRQIRVLATDSEEYLTMNSVGWHLIAFSPDGKSVAAVGGETSSYSNNGHDRAIYVWDVETSQQLWKGLQGESCPLVMRFSPDGSVLACGCAIYGRQYSAGDGCVTLWDAKSGRLLRTYNGDTSADRLTFAWSSLKRAVSGTKTSGPGNAKLPGDNSSPISAISFSPDGKLLAAGDEDSRVRVWPVPAVN